MIALNTVKFEWHEHRFLVYRGWTCFWVPTKIFREAPENKNLGILREIFLFYREDVCCVYSTESPNQGDSYEYIQNTIIYRRAKTSRKHAYIILTPLNPTFI